MAYRRDPVDAHALPNTAPVATAVATGRLDLKADELTVGAANHDPRRHPDARRPFETPDSTMAYVTTNSHPHTPLKRGGANK